MREKRRVLFFNAKREKCDSDSPHLGLAMLAAVLEEKGHEVLVVDYQFNPGADPPAKIVENYKPHVIGLTLYTATMKEAKKILEQLSFFDVPIILGGPHATIYYDELVDMADYVVLGEAESIICDLVENAVLNSRAEIIRTDPPNPQDLPWPDFSSFSGYESIKVYPLLTSRGCPFNCSFCLIRYVSTRKWRPRNPEDCIDEVIHAQKCLPRLNSIIIYDDNPMFRSDHLKHFLNLYLEQKVELPLTIINTRADGLDEETISLLKKAKCPSIAIGVESANPEVFEKIGKGESLRDIEKAAGIIKKYKIPLALCFVIGLEGDSLQKTEDSINFAKKLGANHIYWNMITPFRDTRIRKWYDDNGQVYSLIDHSSWVDGDFMCEEPCAETPDFTVGERKKAYIHAILKTNDNRLSLRDINRLWPYISEYGLYSDFLSWIPNKMVKNLKDLINNSKTAIHILISGGPGKLIKKLKERQAT